jgi:hypothetical protein
MFFAKVRKAFRTDKFQALLGHTLSSRLYALHASLGFAKKFIESIFRRRHDYLYG